MQHYKCRGHFLASHLLFLMKRRKVMIREPIMTNNVCFVNITVLGITCPFTSILMQKNGKNTSSAEAFVLGSVSQGAFSPA